MKKHMGYENKIYLTKDNKIEIWTGEASKDVKDVSKTVFDFNTYYKGCYPECHFTAVGICENLMYAAGTNDLGIPHLFSSADGKVWTQVNIASRLGITEESAYGDIVQILYDNCSHQSFLVTRNGYLVTLPDCPKCVRVRRVSDLPLKSGKIEDETIYLYNVNGNCLSYPLALSVQYRCSWTYAKPHIGKDGMLLDLRDLQDAKERPINGAVIFPEELIDAFLQKYYKNMHIFFVCEKGIKADDAVREARGRGFEKAYSLGGLGDILLDSF